MAAVSRALAESLLRGFTPRMGENYARYRNFDLGQGQHCHVSCLSPYIRRRLLLEQDVVSAAIHAHGLQECEKFVQEVFWRTYFKGWLELRPSVWRDYCRGLEGDLSQLTTDAGLGLGVAAAEEGRTGIECFDAWVNELTTTGYLHNHARMWFASIWIFTLKLPWRIGADFFYRHLLDGDPASNTLSWRWVAGLHTRGKPYAAEAWNIEKFTKQRFRPAEHEFAPDVEGLQDTEPAGLPAVAPLVALPAVDRSKPTLFLITEEDCRPEDFLAQGLDIRSIVVMSASHLRSSRLVSQQVCDFERQALADAAMRFGDSTAPLIEPGAVSKLIEIAVRGGVEQIVTPYIPSGPLRDTLVTVMPELRQLGISFVPIRRSWDERVWPYATAGFFKVKQVIPKILTDFGISP